MKVLIRGVQNLGYFKKFIVSSHEAENKVIEVLMNSEIKLFDIRYIQNHQKIVINQQYGSN